MEGGKVSVILMVEEELENQMIVQTCQELVEWEEKLMEEEKEQVIGGVGIIRRGYLGMMRMLRMKLKGLVMLI